ncbi:small membrane protein YohP [Paracoccus nototheniae]
MSRTTQENIMLKFLGGAVGIIFIIGLLVVIGILSLIF